MLRTPNRKQARLLIERSLKNYPKTRANDRLLIVAVWTAQNVNWKEAPDIFVAYEAINPETIRRTRQKLQEDGKYLPEEEITEKRYKKFEAVKGGDFTQIGLDI